MRSKFDEQLALLHKKLISLGALCEKAISMSAAALTAGDLTLAGQIGDFTQQIVQKERDIEGLCLRLLLQQQPVAGDLRIISAALKMVTDMERIGINSGDIAEILLLKHLTPELDTLNIQEMAQAAIKMVTESIDAFVKMNTGLAKAVIAYDDVVDEHFDRVKRLLIEELRYDRADGEYALDLLMIAKYYERMSDHAVEIAKWVIFAITGQKNNL